MLSSIGPKILGRATDLIFAGILGPGCRPVLSKQQVIAQLRATGDTTKADLLSNVAFTPGQGIDFDAIGSVLLLVVALFVVASLLMWVQAFILQGVLQRTMYDLRQQVEAKLNRLPLPYFDNQPRGELLSRVTNDIDNVSTIAAADHGAAAQLAADGDRRARHDVLDLVDARPHRARDDPDVDHGDQPDRQALAEAVRAAVAQHR